MSETKFTKRRALWLNGATSEQFVVDADNYAVVLSRYPSVYDATEVDQANAALDVAAPDLYAALEAQEVASEIQRGRKMPDPDDPRYTPFIGEYDGYQAPEVRWSLLNEKCRELRRAALAKARGEA